MEEASRTIIEVLEHAIERESDSYNYYVHAAKQAENPIVRKFLLQLADMEKGHWLQLEGYLKELKAQTAITDSIISSFNWGGYR